SGAATNRVRARGPINRPEHPVREDLDQGPTRRYLAVWQRERRPGVVHDVDVVAVLERGAVLQLMPAEDIDGRHVILPAHTFIVRVRAHPARPHLWRDARVERVPGISGRQLD